MNNFGCLNQIKNLNQKKYIDASLNKKKLTELLNISES